MTGLDQSPQTWVLEGQGKVLDKLSVRRKMLLYLNRVAKTCTKAGALGNGARACIQSDVGGLVDGTWGL